MSQWRTKSLPVTPAHAEPVAFVSKRRCLNCGQDRTREEYPKGQPKCIKCVEKFGARRRA